MVEDLRSEMKQQLNDQQKSIEAIVDQAINCKLAALDSRYENIIEQINQRWESALQKQLEKAEQDINATVDIVIAKRDKLHQQQAVSSSSPERKPPGDASPTKQSRTEPGSGSNRARKQPQSTSISTLDSVRTGLMSQYLVPKFSKDTDKPND